MSCLRSCARSYPKRCGWYGMYGRIHENWSGET